MKPIILTVYSGARSVRKVLQEINWQFTEKDVFSNFWGVQFQIKNTRSTKKYNQLKEALKSAGIKSV